MANGIDASMHTMQAPRIDAAAHRALAEAQAIDLPHGYDSMLPRGDLRDQSVWLGDFSSHTGG
jgi:hypothetical protein